MALVVGAICILKNLDPQDLDNWLTSMIYSSYYRLQTANFTPCM